MSTSDPYARTHELAAQHLAGGDATGWFEALYIEAAEGQAVVPWDREEPSPVVRTWLEEEGIDGKDRSAVVVGCGFGRDAELLARHGFRTTGFDIAPTAIKGAHDRHPDSPVTYEVADLLDLPSAWLGAFDLVVESMNLTGIPSGPVREAATAGVTSLVAPGGTLFVVAVAREEGEIVDGPPWPLDRTEAEAFGAGLTTRRFDRVPDADDPTISRWRAEFVRP